MKNKTNVPKISVIVPIYNVEIYLKECLDSIINQTLKDIEIILVDDGSTDGSPKIVDEYAKRDKRIITIHQKNGGYGKACNAGLKIAKGEFISIIESDDYVDTKMLEELYTASQKTKSPIIKGNFDKITTNEIFPMSFSNIIKPTPNGNIIKTDKSLLLMTYESSIWSAIYKRNFLVKNNILMYESKGASYQDVIWKFMTYSLAKQVYLVDKPYYHYRVFSAGSSSTKKGEPLVMFNNYEIIKSFLVEHKIFNKFKKAFYVHQLLDSAFHCQRLNEENMHIFLKILGKKIRTNKDFRKIINDDETSKVLYDGAQLAIRNSLELTSIKYKIKQILKPLIYTPLKVVNKNGIFNKILKKICSSIQKIDFKLEKFKNQNAPPRDMSDKYFEIYLPPLKGLASSKRDKMLFFAPFTTNGGCRVVLEFLCKLYNANYDIHLLTYRSFSQPDLPNTQFHFHVYPNNNKTDVIKRDTKGNIILDDYSIDEWCGEDLLTVVKALDDKFKYKAVLVNYVFYTKIFEIFSKNTSKILMTHDYFSYRNSRQKKLGINDGFYFSTTPKEEKKGLMRADKIIALQPKEANIFNKLTSSNKKIITLTIIPDNEIIKKEPIKNRKINIGYFASDYLNNYYSFKSFFETFEKDNSNEYFNLIVAGGICETIKDRIKNSSQKIVFLGKVNSPIDFYEKVDVVINPDTFISGLKIKNVEAFSFGVPIISTTYSNTGINSKYKFHNCKTNSEIIGYLKKINKDKDFYNELLSASLSTRNKIKNKLKKSIKYLNE